MTPGPPRPSRLFAAYALDLLAGDPKGMPHPVRIMGAGISTGERWLMRPGCPTSELLRGGLLTAVVVIGAWHLSRITVGVTGATGEVLLCWTALATRSLLKESAAVLDALDSGNVEEARRKLARIVGRDTASLDESEILRAVIETVAEGVCDGIIAPLTYLAIGGVPLMLAYKAINTLDSMIGHPEPPYRYFGRVAAHLDDAANFVPARFTAIALITAASFHDQDWRRAWRVWRRDGHKHTSPNAGQSEAAMAGALNVRLGGRNYYACKASVKPCLNAEGRVNTRRDARMSLRIAGTASLLMFSAAWLWCWWRRR
jgi:adenosylcobinamide-phosphate synthase